MNLTLTRKERRPDGIFSELRDEGDTIIAQVLEHAYPACFPDGNGYEPKIPNGTFTCQRGVHRLDGMVTPFTTFEITGVKGHTNLLFHSGNRNADSAGCCLLGAHVAKLGNDQIITNSRQTFAEFMELQQGVDSFTLTVQG